MRASNWPIVREDECLMIGGIMGALAMAFGDGWVAVFGALGLWFVARIEAFGWPGEG